MDVKDFEFDLPEGLIAQRPLAERDASRLMVLNRSTGDTLHRGFRDIRDYLESGDVLVLNDTRVIPARLTDGKKETGGRVEALLVEMLSVGRDGERWSCLIRNSKGLKQGSRVLFGDAAATVLSQLEDGIWECAFPPGFSSRLEALGKTPLPPYIRREPEEEDKARYQTVFAGEAGAVAAPTAGLHFTEGLLDELRAAGVRTAFVTLHTGPGTFMPVRAESIEKHKVQRERYHIGEEAFSEIMRAKEDGRRVVAVGTTATRALESAVITGFDRPALSGYTNLFIYPGFAFRAVDGLLTNFHLPGSTLLMLVCAFAGVGPVIRAYKEAVSSGYRFFSYGDAMLII